MKSGYQQWLGLTLLTLGLIAGGCSSSINDKSNILQTSVSDNAQKSGENQRKQALVEFEEADLDASWSDSDAETISFNGSSIATSAKRGVFIEHSDVTIALPGTYVLNGELTDGSIHVKLEYDGDVKIILNNTSIHNEDGAAIFVEDAGKVVVTLADGTTNTLSDGEQYKLADGVDEPTGTLYSKADLTINGTGKLIIDANYNNAIVGKDRLLLADGQYEINSVDDGIVGRDLLAVRQGSYKLNVAGDGLKSTNDNADKLGSIYIADGEFTIDAGADAIDSIGELLIDNGSFSMISGGGAHAASSVSSAKGIKAATLLTIQGGSFNIDAYEDALHSNGNVDIRGGQLTLTSGDDGVHADQALSIYDGELTVAASYEGLEGMQISIQGGRIELHSSDDGVNVAGGNDQSAFAGRGAASFSSTTDAYLSITGGQLLVDADGDGLDSNGSIEMSGGTVIVNGPENNGNGALDYDESFTLTGGTLIAAGSSGMAMAPSAEQSTQPSILMYYPTNQAAGTLVQLSNEAGEVLVAFKPTKSYQSILISSAELQAGETYTLSSGGQAELDEQLGLGIMTPAQPGTERVSFIISEGVTYVDESGITTMQGGLGQGGGFGGGGRGGGGRGKRDDIAPDAADDRRPMQEDAPADIQSQ